MEKLKFMKGKEVEEQELGPVLTISKILMVPMFLGFVFYLVGGYASAFLAFAIFAGLGYIDYKDGKSKNN